MPLQAAFRGRTRCRRRKKHRTTCNRYSGRALLWHLTQWPFSKRGETNGMHGYVCVQWRGVVRRQRMRREEERQARPMQTQIAQSGRERRWPLPPLPPLPRAGVWVTRRVWVCGCVGVGARVGVGVCVGGWVIKHHHRNLCHLQTHTHTHTAECRDAVWALTTPRSVCTGLHSGAVQYNLRRQSPPIIRGVAPHCTRVRSPATTTSPQLSALLVLLHPLEVPETGRCLT